MINNNPHKTNPRPHTSPKTIFVSAAVHSLIVFTITPFIISVISSSPKWLPFLIVPAYFDPSSNIMMGLLFYLLYLAGLYATPVLIILLSGSLVALVLWLFLRNISNLSFRRILYYSLPATAAFIVILLIVKSVAQDLVASSGIVSNILALVVLTCFSTIIFAIGIGAYGYMQRLSKWKKLFIYLPLIFITVLSSVIFVLLKIEEIHQISRDTTRALNEEKIASLTEPSFDIFLPDYSYASMVLTDARYEYNHRYYESTGSRFQQAKHKYVMSYSAGEQGYEIQQYASGPDDSNCSDPYAFETHSDEELKCREVAASSAGCQVYAKDLNTSTPIHTDFYCKINGTMITITSLSHSIGSSSPYPRITIPEKEVIKIYDSMSQSDIESIKNSVVKPNYR